MADVDHLQQYNDHYGHAKGDQVLQQIADIMQQCLQRPGDLVARLDGGKFVAILQNTDSEGAWLVAEQFRSMLEEANIEHQPSSLGCCITLSAGCASVLPSEDENAAAELLQQAEDLLQQAKQGGRNQVRS
ncbi:MAG: GGDEF domain-containing protein, partial [Chromatiales bacterium]|jgi:diguanylate cyclase (GGDEF)-like protein